MCFLLLYEISWFLQVFLVINLTFPQFPSTKNVQVLCSLVRIAYKVLSFYNIISFNLLYLCIYTMHEPIYLWWFLQGLLFVLICEPSSSTVWTMFLEQCHLKWHKRKDLRHRCSYHEFPFQIKTHYQEKIQAAKIFFMLS